MSEPDPRDADYAEQERQWNEHVAKSRAKGLCEFSGLRATSCVRSICDCFETLEGAEAIVRAAAGRG